MNDDISYYDFSKLNTYKTKCSKYIFLYVIYAMLFVLTNIIIYFLKNDILYGILIVILWVLFANFSIIYFVRTILKYKSIYNFYELLYFGRRVSSTLSFVSKGNDTIYKNVEVIEYFFKDESNKTRMLYLYKTLNIDFEVNEKYELLLVNDLIYGGSIHD